MNKTVSPGSPLLSPASTNASKGKEILRGDEYAQDTEKITLYLKKVAANGQPGQTTVPFSVSNTMTVKKFTKDLCARLSAPSHRARFWVELEASEPTVLTHVFKGYGLLDCPELTLAEASVEDGKTILLEVIQPDGGFPIDKAIAKEIGAANILSSSPQTTSTPLMPTSQPFPSIDTLLALRALGITGGASSKSPQQIEEDQLQQALRLSLMEEQRKYEQQERKKEIDAKVNKEQEEIQKFFNEMNSKPESEKAKKPVEADLLDDFGIEFDEDFDEDTEDFMEEEEEVVEEEDN